MTNTSKPIRCEAEYGVWENEREDGCFAVGDEKVVGYRI
jgi:hypothetical protein